MSEQHKATMGRRQLLRAGMIGFVATAASTLETGTVAADTETNDDKRKARYQAKLHRSSKLLPSQPLSEALREAPHADQAVRASSMPGEIASALAQQSDTRP